KDFLKDKPKEDFEKPPAMPEDIRQLYLQRQREMAEERAQQAALDAKNALPASTTDLKLEEIALPPVPPGMDGAPSAN
ncbi:hypothetical protein WAJ72_23260, partial [Acinetobacter baumannii]